MRQSKTNLLKTKPVKQATEKIIKKSFDVVTHYDAGMSGPFLCACDDQKTANDICFVLNNNRAREGYKFIVVPSNSLT